MEIAIGLGENEDVLKAIEYFPFKIHLAKNNQELLNYLKNPKIDGVIRGSLESNIILDLKKEYPEIFRASLLEKDGHKFLLSPVGIDEGDSISSKITIVEECAKAITLLGEEPKIALISGGRKNDKGRSEKIDQSIETCEKIENLLKDRYDIKHYYILIEEAIKEHANIIIAPDGITGNLIFRSLVLVAGMKSNGALTLNQPYIFIDTSRSQNTQGYINSINLMKKLIEKNRGP
ncbi:MAG: methanogenesis marker protein Mmp4/MtxX [Methanosphaera sp.]|uniref:methanogenesis marker protein Mmp4/MtxX n=1 Tax=Methanosphaera sp. TaxID=2666342 RepID=UPI002E75AB01|nr:methanogenesis marker protein Mmp4/MtxX [Methanosphaera sp.]MEE1117596.1 methanogenesis marker protein Mmp4/MtxX [Methanosphaera sp.]MEE3323947.1 methanogenesis marker protein Mmp4/MtxX [Methanosphaera sp.]